jgi:nitrate/nitrite transport system substrate-binding protein
MTKFSRRQFIITAGAATTGSLLAHGCSTGPSNTSASNNSTTSNTVPAANINPADAPEVTTAKLGFIALTDAAPLIIAKEKGYFDKYGMTGIEIAKQASWAVTRDNLVLGSGGGGIDGAHILTPMPYLISLGTITKGNKVPMYILARLNTNGQGISLSNTYKDLNIGLDSSPLQEAFAKSKASGKELKAAVTFPGGTHDLWMRYWLAAGGINPDQDISTIVVPPPQMVQNVKVGNMETFCVGEPWHAQTVNQGIGYTALTTGELWKDHPEKALAMRADWVDKNPKAAKAILMAVQEAQQWSAKTENKAELAEIVAKREWLKVPVKDIVERYQGKYDYGTGRTEDYSNTLLMKFWRDNASYPYKSHDTWFMTENIRWGYIPADTDVKKLVDAVNREDLWREAAKTLKVPDSEIPKNPSRGVETFFDGVKFDPEDPTAYLKSLKIKKV